MPLIHRRRTAWLLLVFIVVVRVAGLALLKPGQTFELSFVPANGHVIAYPLIADLILPMAVLLLLGWYWLRSLRPGWRGAGLALAEVVLLCVAMLMPAAWLLYGRLQVKPSLTVMSGLRLVQFALDFLALNLLLDTMADRRPWERRLYAFLTSLVLIYAEDLLFASLCLWVATLYLRSLWQVDQWRALLTALLYATGILLVNVTGYHPYYHIKMMAIFALTLILSPPLVTLLYALLWRAKTEWGLGRKALSIAAPVIAVGVIRVTLLPTPPTLPLRHVEQIGVVQLEYDDERVAHFGREYARILDAAITVSQKYYGVTPRESVHLVIAGVGSGGFVHGIQPGPVQKMYGFVPEDRLGVEPPPADVTVYSGEAFPARPFGWLMEFSHQYGKPRYLPWAFGALSEGWGSYGGTRLMKLIYQDYGPDILRAPYDYGTYADALTAYVLNNDDGLDHDFEYPGFRLWVELGEQMGERELYQRYMAVISRDFSTVTGDPSEAAWIAEAFDPDVFARHGFTYPASNRRLDPVLAVVTALAAIAARIGGKTLAKT